MRERVIERKAGARIAAGSLYVATITVLAAVAAWPIYRSLSFLILVLAAVVAGTAIAATARALRWPAWLTALIAFGSLMVLGVPVAVPSRMTSLPEAIAGLGEVLWGSITAWKDLLTVELPAGAYRNLLVPALIVFLFGITAALLLAWRRPPTAALAVPVGLAMVAFGLLFGSPSVSAPLVLGGLAFPAPVETAVGALSLVVSLVWLAWQTYEERSRALRRAASASGVRLSRSRGGSDARRMVLGAGMIAVSVAVAAVLVPAVAEGAERTVLRSGVGPDTALSTAISPLTQYRGNFSEPRSGSVLFRVERTDGAADRVRLATLSHYDGETYRAVDPRGNVDAGRYLRVPARLDAGAGATVTADIRIGQLTGIWLPTLGRVQSIAFEGARASALADSFYYSGDAWGGIQVADGGVRAGDAYTVTAVMPSGAELSRIDAPGVPADQVEAPESLRRWVDEHVEGQGGAALAGLVDLLRGRGYLSHAVSVDLEAPPTWLSEMPGYVFESSASGHSLARIDSLFRALLDREAEVGGAELPLVAAIGDDEQFSVAVALMARELGFPARVVVGARLTSDDGLRTCDRGACRGGDIVAWTEVQSATGDWVPIDVTPQSAVAPQTDLTLQRDPQNETEVRPENAEEVVPPDPVQQDAPAANDSDDEAAADLSGLWAVVRVSGIALVIAGLLLGPFGVITAAKAFRRRARRRSEDPVVRIVAGWDEYVDAAVDHGQPAPRTQTREETAAGFATPRGILLADRADRAVFAKDAVTTAESDEFWGIVEQERRVFSQRESAWRRLMAAVSLRSFTREISPKSAPSGASRRQERRSRRRDGGSRPS
ncbi:DUF3488 and transglutaminase-like domain-containing protein [Microbacterium sp. BR1]|uniref:DUF3488 and transglutaminase-like domain-containing protein n=1 Tax=Microbacterium sp. BR1 TaxID=1070896 RepID=UPI000C2C0E11|nr:transglutaminase domain-containing protein [Microbacterium sp. BR1]